MKRWRVIAIGVVALATIGAAIGGVAYQRDRAVTRARDGSLCASCHEELPSSHPDSACTACHDTSAAGDLWVASLGVASTPPHGAVEQGSCTACHDARRPGDALASEGHRAHGGECTSCHTQDHSASPVVARCESCHADVERHGVTAGEPCTSCHVFGASAPDASPEHRSAGLGEAITASNLHGGIDCRQCHDPHREDAEPACESCHRGHLAEEVALGPEAHRRCVDCHQPHALREQPAIDCLACHTYPERGHGWTASAGVPPAERLATRARITHDGRCGTCHEPHTWTASEARCTECHASEATAISALREGTHTGCTSCHEAHEPRPTGAVCASCHEDVHASSGLPEAHRDCLSCHDAHGARPVAREACASCHRDAHTESASLAAPHRDCLSCHEPHAPPLARAANACADCHRDTASLFARAANVPAEHRCQGCHQPHAFAPSAAIVQCATCHVDAVGRHASHRGTCTACHEEHGAPAGTASSCASCHRDVHPSIGGHADCTSCHAPHLLADAAIDRCEGCHASQVAPLARWERSSPHAGECSACHTPHAETNETPCARCHVAEASRAHTGGHADCTGCHEPHRAPPTSWWSRCQDCHATEATAVAQARGAHGDCASCHRTPGPPLPRCASCHADARNELAHRSHVQVDCASCHAEHGPPAEIGRARCLPCHEDRTRHFPDAPRCQSCHPFAR